MLAAEKTTTEEFGIKKRSHLLRILRKPIGATVPDTLVIESEFGE